MESFACVENSFSRNCHSIRPTGQVLTLNEPKALLTGASFLKEIIVFKVKVEEAAQRKLREGIPSLFPASLNLIVTALCLDCLRMK